MEQRNAEEFFDQACAANYDQLQSRLAPMRGVLDFFTGVILSNLPSHARVLCVGAGTGSELLMLANRFPSWHFTAVEPSVQMLDVCIRKAEEYGITARCEFHHGYLDALPASDPYDGATALLVSQFILEKTARSQFFREIARRLSTAGWMVSADLAADVGSKTYSQLLQIWWYTMKAADVAPEAFERMREAYRRDVAILPPSDVSEIIASGGFETPIHFLQTGLIHAWFARRAI